MTRFPSVEFFEELRARVNANPDLFRRLGTVDMTLVAKIDYDDSSECYEIRFAGYQCIGVRRLDRIGDAAKGSAILSGPYSGWREMIDNIVANGHADLEHTLNTLTLMDTPLRIEADNQLDTDLFYRYQQNLQEFFDNAGERRATP
ncbi:MAG TPA: hypothetical protein VMV27_18130 [Candidatus Binataceae bacterium]|nr:hypothetical protein [Candidatus Binataceae bacterium]